MRQAKSTKLSNAFRSPFQNRRKVTALLASNLGLVLFAGVVVVVIVATKVASPTATADQEPSSNAQQIYVVDGDTLDVDGRRIRLHGIDAPERGQPCTRNGQSYDCGEASKQYLTFLLTGENVTCDRRSTDKWGRDVANCIAGTKDVAAQLVRQGWAIAYLEYSADYVEEERFARSNELGLWAKDFVLPKEWRNRDRSER